MNENEPNVSVEDIDNAPTNLPEQRNDISWEDYSQLLAHFSRIAKEHMELTEETTKLRKRLATGKELDKLIQPFSKKIFEFLCWYCISVGTLLVLQGSGKLPSLSDGVMQILVGSTAATVLGLVGMVLTGIFVGARNPFDKR